MIMAHGISHALWIMTQGTWLTMACGTSHIKIDGWYTGRLTYHDILN